MCTYARTVFECKHQAWGRRLKLCAIAENHRAGELASDCALRKPHGLHSRRIAGQCDKCSELDRKRSLLRAKLNQCREMLRRQYPEYGLGLGVGAGRESGQAGDDGPSCGDDDGADDGRVGLEAVAGGGPVVVGI